MKSLKVVKAFADKEIKFKMYAVGEIISLPDERALNAIEKGLAVEIAEKVEAKEETEEPTKKPAKKTAKKTTKKG
jgi:topoisomerase IA-like protein